MLQQASGGASALQGAHRAAAARASRASARHHALRRTASAASSGHAAWEGVPPPPCNLDVQLPALSRGSVEDPYDLLVRVRRRPHTPRPLTRRAARARWSAAAPAASPARSRARRWG